MEHYTVVRSPFFGSELKTKRWGTHRFGETSPGFARELSSESPSRQSGFQPGTAASSRKRRCAVSHKRGESYGRGQFARVDERSHILVGMTPNF